MNRQEKASVIQELKSDFTQSQALFLVGYKGMTVAQLQRLRKDLLVKGGSVKVAKTTLMKRAAEGKKDSENLIPYFKEQVAVVFAEKDTAAVAKVLVNFAKENEALKVVIGSMEEQLVSSDVVERIASLPAREVLLAMVCGTLKAPMTKLAAVLDALKQAREQQA
jgi:large subunit ribosomal protein L10